MNPWIRLAILIAVVATAFVAVQEMRVRSTMAAWDHLAEARASESPVAALESAREASDGTAAEPWAAFDLTMALYREGGRAEIQRAAQVARATVEEYPDHAVAGLLEEVLPALESYKGS